MRPTEASDRPRRTTQWVWAGRAVALALASAATAARADAPPRGWHAGKAPPASTSKVFSLDLAPGFEVVGSLDVPLADLPIALDGHGTPPPLYIADNLAPFPRTWKPDVHGVMQFTVKAWTGLVRLNDEVGQFGPRTWWSLGVKHEEGSTAKNTGPFSFDVLTGFDSLAQYGVPGPAHFDHVEGTVGPGFSTGTSRWLTGEAMSAAWGTARVIRIPGEHGESLAVFVGTQPVVLGAGHEASAMLILDEVGHANLVAGGVKENGRRIEALVVDVSSDPADPIVRFRAVAEPFDF
ncbi:MAG: hypothetical protein U0414_41215 [Polyangiaceae bacterium]